MKKETQNSHIEHTESKKLFIKQCHSCGTVGEHNKEIERCTQCSKSFLPLKYFEKIHDVHQQYSELFSSADEIEDKDLIRGLIVLW